MPEPQARVRLGGEGGGAKGGGGAFRPRDPNDFRIITLLHVFCFVLVFIITYIIIITLLIINPDLELIIYLR